LDVEQCNNITNRRAVTVFVHSLEANQKKTTFLMSHHSLTAATDVSRADLVQGQDGRRISSYWQ
jgi:hypothetical protein